MASHVVRRQLALATARTTAARSFSSSAITRAAVEPVVAPVTPVADVGTVKPKRPVGAVRGGIFGFLLGFSLAASFASYHLLEEYKQASATLQASVEELQASTQKVSEHVKRIEAVEKDLKALTESTAAKEDVTKLRAELKKTYDGLHLEFLDLRAHVWGMQQDLHDVMKKENTTVRI